MDETTMNALFQRDHGQPRYHVLQGSLQPPPPPSAGQILLRVHAAGVSQADLATLSVPLNDNAPPSVPGREAAGTVLAVGDGAGSFQVGERVAAVAPASACAERVLIDSALVARIPDGVSYAEGAVLLAAVVTAVDAVKAAGVGDGERVVVAGAATAVGSVLVQVLRRLCKARVVAVVEGERDAVIAEKLNAEQIIDRTQQALTKALENTPVRVAFDAAGAGHRLAQAVGRGGLLVQAGEMGKSARERRKRRLEEVCRGRGVRAVKIGLVPTEEKVAEAGRLVTDGVRAAHGPRFGVREYVRALVAAEEGVGSGKVVLLF